MNRDLIIAAPEIPMMAHVGVLRARLKTYAFEHAWAEEELERLLVYLEIASPDERRRVAR